MIQLIHTNTKLRSVNMPVVLAILIEQSYAAYLMDDDASFVKFTGLFV